MKVHTVINPKAKVNLIQWMKNEEKDQSFINKIEDISRLFTIMKDVSDDFVLDRRKMYSVVVCDQHVFLIEMPFHPMEIFDYVEQNPDNLKKFIMKMIANVAKIFLGQMFDEKAAKYA